MKKISLLQILCVGVLLTLFCACQSVPTEKFSKYGGYTKLEGKKTGFFHLEKIQDRWWLIDPEGYVFLSLGLNHVHPRQLLQESNREQNIQKFGDPGETEGRRIDLNSEFVRNFRIMVEDDFKTLGFNTYGYTSYDYRPPYVAYYVRLLGFLNISAWMQPDRINFPDVFTTEWKEGCESFLKEQYDIENIKDDPELLGYWFAPIPIHTKRDAAEMKGDMFWDYPRPEVLTWQETLKISEANTPAKEVFVDLMKERYRGNIARFNRVYGTSCTGFEDINQLSSELLSPARGYEASLDDEAFFRLIIKEYYSSICEIIRKYDQNHLILGDRYNGNTGPSIAALLEARNWVDVIMTHHWGYFRDIKDNLEMMHKLTGKPILIGDSCFSLPYPEMPNPFGPHVESSAERGRMYRQFAENVFSLPYIIGWNWCGYIDNLEEWEKGTQHSGIKNAYGENYTELTDVMKEVNASIYDTIIKGRE